MIRFILLIAILFTTSCSVLKASPLKETVFLPKPEVIKEDRKRAPFNGYWVADAKAYDELKRAYNKVYIAEVDIENAVKIYRKSKGDINTKLDRIEEVKELSKYFREKLRLALSAKAEMAPEVLDQPEDNSLHIHLALTQVIPTNPGVNLAGAAAGFFVPGGGLISYFGQGSVAMEGYVSDLPKEVYEQYKDREGQKTSPFSVKDYQKYAHLRVAIDEWAMQIAELLTTDANVKVEDSYVVSLNPL